MAPVIHVRIGEQIHVQRCCANGGRVARSTLVLMYRYRRSTRRVAEIVTNLEIIALTSLNSRREQIFSPHGVNWKRSLLMASSKASQKQSSQ
jgi:hypothetical protein